MKKIFLILGLVALTSTLGLASSFDSDATFKSVSAFLTAINTEYSKVFKGILIAFSLYIAFFPGGIYGAISGGEGKSVKIIPLIGSLAIFGIAIGFDKIMTGIVIPAFA